MISLGDGTRNEQTQGLRLLSLPNTINQEVKDLELGSTQTKHIVSQKCCQSLLLHKPSLRQPLACLQVLTKSETEKNPAFMLRFLLYSATIKK